MMNGKHTITKYYENHFTCKHTNIYIPYAILCAHYYTLCPFLPIMKLQKKREKKKKADINYIIKSYNSYLDYTRVTNVYAVI